jgi:hypothetical protein
MRGVVWSRCPALICLIALLSLEIKKGAGNINVCIVGIPQREQLVYILQIGVPKIDSFFLCVGIKRKLFKT